MAATRYLPSAATLMLLGLNLGAGYLLFARAPDWFRWLTLTVLQVAIDAAVRPTRMSLPIAVGRMALKTALWPIFAGGGAGILRLLGLDLYLRGRLEVIALLSLGAAHAAGEWLLGADSPDGERDREAQANGRAMEAAGAARRALWMRDVQWLLAILGVPWIWHALSGPGTGALLAAGALFLWVCRPASGSRPGPDD